MFLHPLALVGLAAAAIPALLHLLQRRVPPEAEFPPLRYLRQAERQHARRLRLRHLLLLALRTALIILVILAAAGPRVRARAGGTHQPTALAVILDNSPSAGAVLDGRPVFDRLRVAARTSIARAALQDRVWLILADGLVRGGSRESLLAALDSTGPGGVRLDLTRAVERAARLVDAEPLAGHEVHLLSDLQRSSLGAGAAAVPRDVRVLALAASSRPPVNRGIVQARATENAVTVTVGGTPDAAAAPVSLRLGGRDVGRVLAAPGAVVSLPLPALAAGWWVAEAALDPDELRADDVRPVAWRVAPPARVTAEPEAGPFVDAALAVLRDGHRVSPGGGVGDIVIGTLAAAGREASIVLPPADPSLLGPTNRALGAIGVRWRFGAPGTPGPLASVAVPGVAGAAVSRRLRVEGPADDAAVLATVNGEPWLVRAGTTVLLGSRLDSSWTALVTSPAFVAFVDALVNRVAKGEDPVAGAEGAPRVAFDVRGADTVGATVYGPDPRESDLTPADAGELRRALAAEVLDDAGFAAGRFAGLRAADLGAALLVAALLLALVELSVASLTR